VRPGNRHWMGGRVVMRPPDYFEKVRAHARRRWEQLEADPELAGPWHQLFRQVQSPRHVLSELLQNADDAEARNAWARIEDDEFVFEHDGRDFDETEFASLCKFGYSNKRNLHTIGFRGVGFKSTFSLGDQVHLLTPSLSVAFDRERFTEPVWMDRDSPARTTQVRVRILDAARRQELERNLDEWTTSLLSLLFFRNIQRLEVQGVQVRRHTVGLGPVARSEWVALSENQAEPYLVVHSGPEPFPVAAVEEVRRERMGDEDLEFPPCQVDLVLGADVAPKLFVVLPTGVVTNLPFACNAPFVQDPSRIEIKDPSISPTNRWLLERAGRCAAEAMLAWLGQYDSGLEDRSRAYMLLPDVDPEDESLAGVCATICEKAFQDTINGTAFLLTEDGALVESKACIAVPRELYDIWRPEQVSALLDTSRRPLLCRHIAEEHCRVLVNQKAVEKVEDDGVLEALRSHRPPKPETWRQLLLFWGFVGDATKYYPYRPPPVDLAIVPVEGSDVLHRSAGVVRLGERKLLPHEEDWQFLSDYLLVLNPNWSRFLAQQRRAASETQQDGLKRQVERAYEVLASIALQETSDVSRIIERVADQFLAQSDRSMADYIRLTQIAAALNASIPAAFEYFTRDGARRRTEHVVVADVDGDLDSFVSERWYDGHVIHEAYWREFRSCSSQQWDRWVRSERSRLLTFVPFDRVERFVRGRAEIARVVQERGSAEPVYFPYVTNTFVVEDWDFSQDHWQHWCRLAEDDPEFWGRLLSRIICLPNRYWESAIAAAAKQIATTGTRKTITNDELLPAWIVRFQGLPCLEDTRGRYREPAELLRRTPETEALLDVEPFVRAEHDTERNRPLLVKLGVRDTPTGWRDSVLWRRQKPRPCMRSRSGIIGWISWLPNARPKNCRR